MRLLLALLPAALFALITCLVAAGGPARSADERLRRAVAACGLPSRAAEFFADLGGMGAAAPVLAAAAGYAAWRGRRQGAPRWWLPPLAAALAMAAVPALVAPLKAVLDRAAPPGPLAGGSGFYPSGHAATALVGYGAAALLLLPRPRLRRPLAAAVALVNAAVGVGLVARGYHWPLDVAGSWCLGCCLLWAVWRVRAGRAGG
ncbi:phosphatase PAP2 family protein [Streptomyces sp. B1866]|uniref:phosphatase PAP2 family protein n=1 Tax=Streptomyces sp. B1866 TaxID=3075431 RepID=UPI0028903322|nr:phosphatase PAP2 family protein [Streptomyces sp. B1866]MDT3399745.1 phosphatase PAP2 family protein [Streptomyces sp. B1866]